MLNQMFPDYNLSSTGMTVDYEPTSEWKVKDNPYFELFKQSQYV